MQCSVALWLPWHSSQWTWIFIRQVCECVFSSKCGKMRFFCNICHVEHAQNHKHLGALPLMPEYLGGFCNVMIWFYQFVIGFLWTLSDETKIGPKPIRGQFFQILFRNWDTESSFPRPSFAKPTQNDFVMVIDKFVKVLPSVSQWLAMPSNDRTWVW